MVVYLSEKGEQVRVLEAYPIYQSTEQCFLCEKLVSLERFVISVSDFYAHFSPVRLALSTQEKLDLYFYVFAGRRDVYAKSYYNKEGRFGYFPSYRYGWKQLPPEKRTCEPLTDAVLKKHLQGRESFGIYPLQLDDSCRFLVLDFDKADWREVSRLVRKLCEKLGIQAHVEISRSGNGTHIWFFFEGSLTGHDARLFGRKLLKLAMQESERLPVSNLSFLQGSVDLSAGIGSF